MMDFDDPVLSAAPVGETRDGGTPETEREVTEALMLASGPATVRELAMAFLDAQWHRNALENEVQWLRAALGRSVPAEPTPESWNPELYKIDAKHLREVATIIQRVLEHRTSTMNDSQVAAWAASEVLEDFGAMLRGAPPQGEPPPEPVKCPMCRSEKVMASTLSHCTDCGEDFYTQEQSRASSAAYSAVTGRPLKTLRRRSAAKPVGGEPPTP